MGTVSITGAGAAAGSAADLALRREAVVFLASAVRGLDDGAGLAAAPFFFVVFVDFAVFAFLAVFAAMVGLLSTAAQAGRR